MPSSPTLLPSAGEGSTKKPIYRARERGRRSGGEGPYFRNFPNTSSNTFGNGDSMFTGFPVKGWTKEREYACRKNLW